MDEDLNYVMSHLQQAEDELIEAVRNYLVDDTINQLIEDLTHRIVLIRYQVSDINERLKRFKRAKIY